MAFFFHNDVCPAQGPERPFWRAHYVTESFFLLSCTAISMGVHTSSIVYIAVCVFGEPVDTFLLKLSKQRDTLDILLSGI